jgi:RNA polymerase sigma factor (sigma-70 family)
VNSSEADLLLACQRNDRKAQFAFYQRYKGKMLGLCRRYAASNAEAEDILQDAFVKIFANVHTVHKNESVGGWVRNVVVRTAIDQYRRNRITADEVAYDDSVEKVEHQALILDQLHTEDILKAIQQLPEGYRLVLNLYIIDGYSHAEIAQMLKISEGTSKSQLSRAREVLRKKLKEIGIVA